MFGSEDFCADVGVTRTPSHAELLYARSALVMHARAFRLSPIDMVCVDYKDLARCRHEADDGYTLGFVGKQAIHPDQLAPILAAFSPKPEEIAAAQRIIDAYQANVGGVG